MLLLVQFVVNPSIASRPQSARVSSRPSTASSSDSSESIPTVASLNGMTESSLAANIEQLKPNLNFFNIDKVVNSLRETLEQEKVALYEDIDYVRELLEEEYKFERE